MKYIHPLPIIAVALLGLGPLLPAQEADNRAAAPATSDEDAIVPDWQLAFKNLAKSERTAYAKHIVEASRLFNQKRIIEALNEVAEAVKVFDQGPAALNLLGACQVEFRNCVGITWKSRAFQQDLSSVQLCSPCLQMVHLVESHLSVLNV